jgi:hypothetical protein
MITHYFVNLGHLYLVHVGVWGAYYGFMSIKDGKEIHIKRMLTISLLLAIFSAVAHNHFTHFLKGGL